MKKQFVLATMLPLLLTGCAQLGPKTEALPAYVDGYKAFIGQKQAEDVIYARGTNVSFSINITGATSVGIAGIVPQRSIMPKEASTTEKLIDAGAGILKTAGGVYLGTVVAHELGSTPKTVEPTVVTKEVPVFIGPTGPIQ